jgi:ribonuclease BN (tRNA processing enzyme)
VEVILLGSGGWIPTSRRETCSALVRSGADALLIDAGTGVQRLIEEPDLLGGAERVDVLLTHFHLDHVVGLSYLPSLPVSEPPVVWGSGELLWGTTTSAILDRLLTQPLFAASAAELTREVRELKADLELGSFRITTRVQERHSGPTLAFRFGDSFAYCTDTSADPETARFASGARMLLHEAWYAAPTADEMGHTASGEAGRIARDAGVDRLVLIHVHPLLSSDEDLARDARAVFSETVVGQDPLRL